MSDQNKNNKNKLTDTENTNLNEQELSLEEQQKLMEKYDIESNTRKLTGILGWVVFIVLVAFSLLRCCFVTYFHAVSSETRNEEDECGLV